MSLNKPNYKLLLLILLNIIASFTLINIPINNNEHIPASITGKIPVSIIMYHSILEHSKLLGDYVVTPKQFENDIKYLLDNGFNIITMTDLINFVKTDHYILPQNPVIITLDDGYYNNYVYAFPIAKKYDIPFVLSILGKYTDLEDGQIKQNPNFSHVSWENIKEMHESGLVEMQNHTYELHTVTRERSASLKNKNESLEDYRQFLTNDIMKLQNLFKENIDITPNTFTYPFGHISPESVDILKDLGFEATLSCYEGINYISKGDIDLLFHLKRFNRPYGLSSQDFFKNKLEYSDPFRTLS